MPKIPRISSKQLIKAFEKMGFSKVGQKGSHIKMKDSTGKVVIIPDHKNIKLGTLKKGILNPLNISVSELIDFL